MKKGIAPILLLLIVIFVAGAGVAISRVYLNNPKSTGSSESVNTENIFKSSDNLCQVITADEVSTMLGKKILKTNDVTTNTIHSCQYYLTDNDAVIVNHDLANVDDQKKADEFLGWKIVVNSGIPMENFSVIQENGKINRLFLVINTEEYVAVNRTSAQALTEEETVDFAAKLAAFLKGKVPVGANTGVTKEDTAPTASPTLAPTKSIVPLPQETDIVRTFFNLIGEKRPGDAVGMMTSSITNDDSQKQAWAVQFNSINSVKILSVDPSMPEEWSNTAHTYKVTLDVSMSPNSANAVIPYYGWTNGQNTRWVTIEKENNLWRIKGLATGP